MNIPGRVHSNADYVLVKRFEVENFFDRGMDHEILIWDNRLVQLQSINIMQLQCHWYIQNFNGMHSYFLFLGELSKISSFPWITDVPPSIFSDFNTQKSYNPLNSGYIT